MIISFFEEFPTKQDLEKIKLINFPSKLYLASSSLEEFLKVKKKIKSKYVLEVIYWPTLTEQEGYWISPFSKTSGLKRIFKELQNKNIPVMLDLEFPVKRSHILKRLFVCMKNKSIIFDFIKNYKGKVYTAEYFYAKKGFLSPNLKNKKIKMLYTSFRHYSDEFIKQTAKKAIVGLGTITKGVEKQSSILSPNKLKSELNLLKNQKEVIIFRLGGLNKQYLKAIKESSSL